ncbi:hypothetical protein BDV95DRAFT_604185 [Massariosphaeria phaeospora]|uniref:Uncharacterized protein n=1 Tax=Massariosphaeria phaeospora TaxID=100035 RepID=A0A7C8IBK3_9PLEO|nr:hypothetical protein BDV95DRAFT_604185 [Massariosphaeria phaeospora]
MPIATKSYGPALAAFLALSFTYTAIEARAEGNTIDAARTRWQQQMQRGNQAMSAYGTRLLEQEEDKHE